MGDEDTAIKSCISKDQAVVIKCEILNIHMKKEMKSNGLILSKSNDAITKRHSECKNRTKYHRFHTPNGAQNVEEHRKTPSKGAIQIKNSILFENFYLKEAVVLINDSFHCGSTHFSDILNKFSEAKIKENRDKSSCESSKVMFGKKPRKQCKYKPSAEKNVATAITQLNISDIL